MHRAMLRLQLFLFGMALTTTGCARHPDNARATFTTEGLRFFAATRVTPGGDSLRVSITARNDARAERVLSGGMCGDPFVIRIYREPVGRKRPTPAWDSELWRRATDPPNTDPPTVVCGATALLRTLPPGDSAMVAVLVVPVRAVLGDSLPAGTYRLRAEYYETVDAGTVELRLTR